MKNETTIDPLVRTLSISFFEQEYDYFLDVCFQLREYYNKRVIAKKESFDRYIHGGLFDDIEEQLELFKVYKEAEKELIHIEKSDWLIAAVSIAKGIESGWPYDFIGTHVLLMVNSGLTCEEKNIYNWIEDEIKSFFVYPKLCGYKNYISTNLV